MHRGDKAGRQAERSFTKSGQQNNFLKANLINIIKMDAKECWGQGDWHDGLSPLKRTESYCLVQHTWQKNFIQSD